MAVDVGNLAIRLSLDSANFEQSMKSIDRNLKAMGQEMRAAQNRGNVWGNSVTGLTTKQEGLTRMLSAQDIKVRRLRDAYERSKAETGANSEATERLAIQLNRATAEYNRTETELNAVRDALRRQADELRLSQSAWTQLGERMRQVGATMSAVGDKMTAIGKNMSMKVTAPIVAMGTLAAKSAIDFESAFAGVRKTVDATEEEFKALSDGIRGMAKEIPAAATEIAGVAEAAGQLGIKKESILGFTRTMVDLGVATNMSSEEAATALARLANITNMNQKDFDRLGSSIVSLGNNFATTEKEIVEMGLRLAGAGAQVGMSEADILGLSTALTSVGIQAEMGGSAFSRVMVQMQLATSTGFTKVQELSKKTGHSLRDLQMMASHSGKAFGNMAEDMGMTKKELTAIVNAGVELEGFSKIAGMTGEQFKQAFEKDAVGAIGSFIDGLANAEDSGDTAINMLQEMGITSVLLRDSLLRAGGASELFGSAIKVSNDGWDENIALTNEAEERYKTTASQLQIMVNYFKDLGITLGAIILPVINSLIEKMKPLIEKFADMSMETQKTILVIAGIAAAIGPVLVVVGALVSSIGAILTAFGTVSAAIAVLTTGVASAVPAVSALAAVFTVLTGPVGIAIAAIAGVAAIGLLIYKNWEPIKAFFADLWTTIGDSGVAVWDSLKDVWQSTVQGFKDLWSTVSGFFSDLWSSISTAAISIWDSLIEKWTAVVSLLTEIFSPMIGFFQGLWSTIIATATVSFQTFTDVLSTVWKNIKTIAESAWIIIKNVILGPILLLINLVTGDMEEFRSNLTAIWKNISVEAEKIWTALKESIVKVISALIKTGTSLWTNFKTTLTNLNSAVKETVTGIWARLKSSVVEITSNLVVSAFKKWNELKTGLFDLVGNIVKDALKKWDDLKTNTLSKINEVKNNVINPLKEIDLKKIGKDIIQGLIDGIKNKIEDVTKAVKGVTDAITGKIKDILQIKSPSRVMMGYGDNIGQGLAIGIASTESANKKAIEGVAKVLSTAAKKNADEVTKIATDAEKARTAIQKEYASKRAELSRKSSQSSQTALKTSKNKKGQIVTTGTQRVHNIRADASAKLIKLNEDERKKLASINTKAWADMQKKEAEVSKARLESVKTYVADKKSLDEMSLVAESEVWRKSLVLFKEGTKERVEIQKAYQASLKAINDEVVRINEEFQGKIKKINDDLAKSERELSDEYDKTFSARVSAITGFAGLFDEFVVKMENSGSDLIQNLQSQVTGLTDWRAVLDSLWGKIDDQALMEELEAMGPNALGELQALNMLTKEQLTQYSGLFREKSELARKQAEHELVGMKADTTDRITELRVVANAELETLRADWMIKIQSITKSTDTELMSLKKIGVNAGQGLLDGLASMESSLVEKAKSIANAVSAAMASALQVKSPSRVTMKIGQFVGEGLEVGMENSIASIRRAARMMADAAVPDVGNARVPGYSAQYGVGNGSGSIDNSKSFAPTVTIYTQDSGAKEMERTLRRMAFSF